MSGLFHTLDSEGAGGLTLEQLQSGAESVPEFQQKLRVMDIQGDDLRVLFKMLDEDGSGVAIV